MKLKYTPISDIIYFNHFGGGYPNENIQPKQGRSKNVPNFLQRK